MRVASRPTPNPATTFQFDCPLHAIFERVANKHRNWKAVCYGEESLTYGELNRKCNGLAHWLIAKGVGVGHRVGVCLRPGFGIIIALIAIQKAGAAYVPIDPDYPEERIRSIVEDAALDLTLSGEDIIEKFRSVLTCPYAYPFLDPVEEDSKSLNPELDVSGKATACIFYTSGTTGQPKGIPISYFSLAYYVLSAIKQFGVNPADSFITIAKFSFSISLFDLMASMVSGAKLNILSREAIMDYTQLASTIEKSTVVHIGPALLRGVLHYIKKQIPDFSRFNQVRHISSGGDVVAPDLLEDLKTVFSNAEVYVIYGCTEIACMGCFYFARRDAVVDRSYVGKPFPGTSCILLGDRGETVRDGEVGEICFKGPGVMTSYLNRPELSKKAFIAIDNSIFFRTGDMGRIHTSGDLEFLGRRDFQIKIRGQRIELLEIESHLRKAPGVKDAILSTAPIGTGEIRLIAYLTVEDRSHFELDPVRMHLRQFLPEYMQPSGWMILDKMPLNVNLKIARKALPPPTAENTINTETYAEPRNETESLMANLWQQVLGIPRVGINDDFYNIGGDSLLAMNLCMLAAENGITVSPSQLRNAPTIEKLIKTGMRRDPEEGRKPYTPFSGILTHLPPFILRFLREAGPRTPDQWNISRMLVAKRRLSPQFLEAAFRHLGARHDAFRLQFRRDADRWQATVAPTPETTIAFRRVDLSGLPVSEQDTAIAACAKELQMTIRLNGGPIANMALFEMGENQPQKLFFIVHHFAMDVLSWRNFWLEFDSIYRRFESGGDTSIHAASTSFSEWTQILKPYSDSAEVEADARGWACQDWSHVARLKKDLNQDGAVNTNGSAQVVQFTLSEAETRWLLRNKREGFNAERIFIAGLSVALSRWQGSAVYFDRLLHGRDIALPEMDLSGTIGCLISYAPTLLKIDNRKACEDILNDVSSQMDRFPGNHINLYKYLGSNPALVERLNGLPEPEVLFNYRGATDDVIESGSLFGQTYTLPGMDHDPEKVRLYAIAIVIDLIKDRLEARFVFSANMHRRASIEALSFEMFNYIKAMIRL